MYKELFIQVFSFMGGVLLNKKQLRNNKPNLVTKQVDKKNKPV